MLRPDPLQRAVLISILLAASSAQAVQVIDGDATLTLDSDIRSTESILVKDQATLVLRGMELELQQAYDGELVIALEGRARLIMDGARVASKRRLALSASGSSSIDATRSSLLVSELRVSTQGTVTLTESAVQGLADIKAARVFLVRSRLSTEHLDLEASDLVKVDGCPVLDNLHHVSAPQVRLADSASSTKERLLLRSTGASLSLSNLTAEGPAIDLEAAYEAAVEGSVLRARGSDAATLRLSGRSLGISGTRLSASGAKRAGVLLRAGALEARNLTVDGACAAGCSNVTFEGWASSALLADTLVTLKGGSGRGAGEHGANATLILAATKLVLSGLTATVRGGAGAEGPLVGGNGGNATVLLRAGTLALDGASLDLGGGDGGDGGFDLGRELRLGGNGGESSATVAAGEADIEGLAYSGAGGFPGDGSKGPGICGGDSLSLAAPRLSVEGSAADANGGKGREPDYMQKASHGCDGRIGISGERVQVRRTLLKAAGGDCAPATQWAALGGSGLVSLSGSDVELEELTVRATGGTGGIGPEMPSFRAEGWGNLTVDGSRTLAVDRLDAAADTTVESGAGTVGDLSVSGAVTLGGRLRLVRPRLNKALSPLLGSVRSPTRDRYPLDITIVYGVNVTVRDRVGVPLPGARASLYSAFGTTPLHTATSDAEGSAMLEAEAETITRQKDNFQGNFRLVVSALGAESSKGVILDSSKALTVALDAQLPTPTPAPPAGVGEGAPTATPAPAGEAAVPTPRPTPSPPPERAVTATPRPDPAELLPEAEAEMEARPERALMLCDEALSSEPGSRAAMLLRGEALLRLGRADEARLAADQLIALDASDPEARALDERARELSAKAEAPPAASWTWTVVKWLVGALVAVFALGVAALMLAGPVEEDREVAALRESAQQWAQQGYSAEQVREHLVGLGYPPEKVEAALGGGKRTG